MKSFESLGLNEDVLKVLKVKGFEEPTHIQEQVIPAILNGTKDVVGQAQTGTGKTAAFGLPIMELLDDKAKHVQMIVLTPTRELAIQVAEELNSLKGRKHLQIIPVYGGQSIFMQLKSLQRGVDIVVGTPGRVIDHIQRKSLLLDKISYFVLDEADEMLNMGFLDDVIRIMKQTPKNKRTLLFSATMPDEIMKIAKNHMGAYEMFRAAEEQLTVSKTDQIYFEVSTTEKFESLCRIIDTEKELYGIVFCRTRNNVKTISKRLIHRGYAADALHGDRSQRQREEILKRFRSRRINILVATDVAARGIDVQDLTHVINYTLPQDPESYIHRIGRTGRAGKEGIAITFVTPSEFKTLDAITKTTKTKIRRETMPRMKDVAASNKNDIIEKIEDVLKAEPNSDFLKMSAELLKKHAPEKALASLLQHYLQDELGVHDGNDEAGFVDQKGKTRLFVTHGRLDGLTAKKLAGLIISICKIPAEKIHDLRILDKYSFVSLPFRDAEKLLAHFKKNEKGNNLIFRKAKDGHR